MKLDFSSERVQRRAAASVSSACSSRAYIYCLLELNMQGPAYTPIGPFQSSENKPPVGPYIFGVCGRSCSSSVASATEGQQTFSALWKREEEERL